jgi:HAD superfamily hydrolase (TIGR01484 family)
MHARLQNWQPAAADLSRVIDELPVTKLECVALTPEEAVRVQAVLDEAADGLDYGWAIAPGMTARFVNILARGISKGAAVARVGEQLGVPRAQMMGVGDGPNDAPLFDAVGFSVAMGNAEWALKQAANVVTASVEEDGLALAIENYILNAVYQV